MRAERRFILESLSDTSRPNQDFHRHIVAVAAPGNPDPSRYDILWAPRGESLVQDVLTPAKWIQLLSSTTIEKAVFFLSRKPHTSSDSDDDEENHYERDRHDSGSVSCTSTDVFISGSVTSGTTMSRYDQDSLYGQINQESVGNSSRETTHSEGWGTPVESSREQHNSYSAFATQALQSLDESSLNLKRSEGSCNEQSVVEASPDTFELAISPGNLIPVQRDGAWGMVVPHDSQRLLTWLDDQVDTITELRSVWGGHYDTDEDHDGLVTLPHMHTGSHEDCQSIPSTGNQEKHTNSIRHPSPLSEPKRGPENLSEWSQEGDTDESEIHTAIANGHPDRLPPPKRYTSYQNRRKWHQEVSSNFTGLINFPFFTWRVKRGAAEHTGLLARHESDDTVVRILAKIHESINTDESSYKALYSRAYRCTADDLFLRHPDLVERIRCQKDSEDKDGGEHGKPSEEHFMSQNGGHIEEKIQRESGDQEGSERNVPDSEGSNQRLVLDRPGPEAGKDKKEKQIMSSASAERYPLRPSGTDGMASPTRSEGGPSKSEMKEHANNEVPSQDSSQGLGEGLRLKEQLLEVSQSIFRAFFPSQGASSSPDYYHPLCERFWGSLDEIFRVCFAFTKKTPLITDIPAANNVVDYIVPRRPPMRDQRSTHGLFCDSRFAEQRAQEEENLW